MREQGMKVLLTGGGSGGHITPVLAVAKALKKLDSTIETVYCISVGDKLLHLPHEHEDIDRVVKIRSGKLRRYHGEGIKQLLDIPTLVKNIRDLFFVVIGLFQSIKILKREKPDVIFIKGGFVGVPVGLAAALLKVPFITHDSDAVPGLANRLISRWAKMHAVAMPVENYSYPKENTIQVGVPISSQYQKVSRKQQLEYIEEIGLPDKAEVLYITGGGLGAIRLNTAITKIARALLGRRPNLFIVHIAGPGHQQLLRQQYDHALHGKTKRVIVKDFVSDAYKYSGAADVIVARAGATTLAEFAAQQKACIIVPNPQLTGGHQLRNTEVLTKLGAVRMVSDELVQKNPELLLKDIEDLLESVNIRAKLAVTFNKTADHEAADKLAKLLIKQMQKT